MRSALPSSRSLLPLRPLLPLAALAAGCASPPPASPEPLPAASHEAPPAPLPPRPAASASASASPEPPPPACFPRAMASAEIRAASLEGPKLTLCLKPLENDSDAGPCLSVDLKGRAVSSAPPAPAPETMPEPRADKGPVVTATASEVKVCPEGAKTDRACRTVRVGKKTVAWPGHGEQKQEQLIASVSPDGKQLALLAPEPIGKQTAPDEGPYKVYVEVHDLEKKTRKHRVLFPAGSERSPGLFGDRSDDWKVSWVGDKLLLSAYRCCGPAGNQVLFDAASGKIAPLGDPALFERPREGLLLIGNEERGMGKPKVTLSLVHVDTLKSTELPLPASPRDEPETSVLRGFKLDGGKWLVAHTNPPGLVWVDIEGETIADKLALPLCQLWPRALRSSQPWSRRHGVRRAFGQGDSRAGLACAQPRFRAHRPEAA